MIIDDFVNISVSSKNITYYRSIGYILKTGDNFNIKIEDLQKTSAFKVNVKCDNCGDEKYIQYRLYNNNIEKSKMYYCIKCKHLKTEDTKLKKYGNKNYNNIEKNKETCLKKYGVDHFNKLECSKKI